MVRGGFRGRENVLAMAWPVICVAFAACLVGPGLFAVRLLFGRVRLFHPIRYIVEARFAHLVCVCVCVCQIEADVKRHIDKTAEGVRDMRGSIMTNTGNITDSVCSRILIKLLPVVLSGELDQSE